MPKVSVIIPIYNAEKYLVRCLNSAINQTLQDIEIIAVNDCSKDNSLEIIQNYTKKDTRIKVINNETNKGEGATRNAGLKEAQGKYIVFLDSDDELDLKFCEKLYAKVQSNEDIIFGNCLRKIENKEDYIDVNKLTVENDNILYFCGYLWTNAYKKELLDKFSIKFTPNVPLAADLLFINNVLEHAKTFSYAKNAIYIYHRRLDSMNGEVLSDEKINSGLFVFNKMLDNFNAISEIVKNKEGYEYYFNDAFFNCFNMTFKNDNKRKRVDCAKTLVNLYKKMIHKDLLIKNLKEKYPLLEIYLLNNESEKIIELFQLTKNEFIVKNLRYKIGKKQ